MPRTTVVGALAIIVCSVACVAALSRQPSVTFAPYDDACELADLCSARENLLKLVKSRDLRGMLALTSSSFNDADSDSLRDFQRLLGQPDSPIWAELQKILELGGAVRRGDPQPSFCAPYLFVRMPAGDALLEQAKSDGHVAGVITKSARVYAQPNGSGPVLGTVGHELVAETGLKPNWRSPADRGGWVEVHWNGKIGYIERANLWSEEDPHVCLSKENGVWKISEFRSPDGL